MTDDAPAPSPAACSFTATWLSAGPEHAAALTADGAVVLWGSNEFSQLAMSNVEVATLVRPQPLSSLSTRKVISLACGGSHTLAVVQEGAGGSVSGALMAWGTGTVGQLGLGEGTQLADEPKVVELPPSAASAGKAPAVTAVSAGLVSSAAISVFGEAFVWGDASIGRLGLAGVEDPMTVPGAPLPLVNAAKRWKPSPVPFSASDVGGGSGAPLVSCVALGGSFTLFVVVPAGSTTGAGVLFVAGGLGIDITKDIYATTFDAGVEADAAIEREISGVPRMKTPAPVAPFFTRPVVLTAYAGARHAAVIVADELAGGAPRLYTAGKGWLGHAEDVATGSTPAAQLALPSPRLSPSFGLVAGALANVDGASRPRTSCG